MKYKIIETKPAYYIWTYEVEAENEEQALNAVLDGAVEPSEAEMLFDEDAETHYEIDDTN